MKKFRISDIVTIVLFISIIFGFAAAFVVMPDKDENSFETELQRFPNANGKDNDYTGADYLIHGELADDFDEYFCDQFPLRKQFVSLKAFTELASFRGVSNGVLYSNGRLATVRFNSVGTSGNTERYSKQHVDTLMESLKGELDKLDIPVKVMLPPRTIDVIAPAIGYPTDIGTALNTQVKNALGDYYVDVLPVMHEMQDKGYCVYYNTDHHWTSTGAFYAYEKAVEAFGDNAFDFESFDFETVYDDFRGTACRNGNYFFLNGEEIQVVKYDGYDKLKVELGRNLEYMEEKDGMYDLGALNGADPYNVFLHGKTRYLRITDTKDTEKETLLVVKDSFAHSLVPILARNYNIVMVDIDLLIDPKLGTKIDLANLVNKTGADKVLLVYNLQNVIENSNLAYITAGKAEK